MSGESGFWTGETLHCALELFANPEDLIQVEKGKTYDCFSCWSYTWTSWTFQSGEWPRPLWPSVSCISAPRLGICSVNESFPPRAKLSWLPASHLTPLPRFAPLSSR